MHCTTEFVICRFGQVIKTVFLHVIVMVLNVLIIHYTCSIYSPFCMILYSFSILIVAIGLFRQESGWLLMISFNFFMNIDFNS